MKTRTVKTKIKQLVARVGSYEQVAFLLGITDRYVRMLEKSKVPGKFLYPVICRLYDTTFKRR